MAWGGVGWRNHPFIGLTLLLKDDRPVPKDLAGRDLSHSEGVEDSTHLQLRRPAMPARPKGQGTRSRSDVHGAAREEAVR